MSDGWTALRQPHMIPRAKHVAGAVEGSQAPSGPQRGMGIMGASQSPGIKHRCVLWHATGGDRKTSCKWREKGHSDMAA